MILGVSYILRFALTFVLARFLQPEQLGVYSWSVTVFGIAVIFTNFGLDFFLIRKIPEYRNTIESMVGSVINHTKKQVKINTLLVISIILPISYFSTYFFEGASKYNLELMVILLALPFSAYLLIFSTSLRSFDFPLTGQFIDSILQTGILCLLIFFSFTVFSGSISKDGGTLQLVSLFVCSWILSYFIGSFFFKKNIKIQGNLEYSKKDTKAWRTDSFTIMIGVLGWSLLGRSDVFLLGFLVAPSEIGAYFICIRLAEILLFFSSVSYFIWAGEISKLFQENNLEQTQKLLKKSSRLCFISTFILMCLGLNFAEEILFFVNENYVDDVFIFRIALFVFFIVGSAGMLNPMFYILGQQEFLAKLQWIIGLIFVVLIFLAVPIYGIKGCIIVFAICKGFYIMTLGVRLKTKHNLSILPI